MMRPGDVIGKKIPLTLMVRYPSDFRFYQLAKPNNNNSLIKVPANDIIVALLII